MSRDGGGPPVLLAVFAGALGLLLLSACLDDGPGARSTADIPGLDPAEEIDLVEVEPTTPSDDSFVWLWAYDVGDLPTVDVGHPTTALLEDAHREDGDPEALLCLGGASGSSCEVEDDDMPAISGVTFGQSDVRAWAWAFVPEEAAAVRFTDQDGNTSWQRPHERLVMFPDTVTDDPDGNCTCRLDAIGTDGSVIVSVDMETSSYASD